jgi:predicted RND superfamily exporter protein
MKNENPQTRGDGFARLILNNPLLSLFVSVLLLLGAGYGAKNLSMSSDYSYYFDEDNPQRQAFEKIQNVYSKEDSALIVIAPSDGTVFKKETLAGIVELTDKAWKTPYSSRVDSITNFQYSYAEEDDLIVKDLVFKNELEGLNSSKLLKIKSVALNEPLLKGRILSENAGITAVNITVNLPGKSPMEVPEVAAYVRKLAKEFEDKYPGHKTYLSGMAMLNNAFNEAGMGDMMTLTPIMYGLILLIMAITLRSLFSVVATFIILIFSVVFGMGMAGWFGIPITPVSSMAPTVIVTLAIADSIHILKTILKNLSNGMEKKEAIIKGLDINLKPVFLTSFTTAIGFLSLNFGDTPPFHDLGNITAMGVMAAFFYSVVLLPVLILWLPIKTPAKERTTESTSLKNFGNLMAKNKGLVSLITIALTIGLGTQIPKIKLNDQFVQYFDERIQFRTDSEFMMNNLTGIYQVYYDLDSGESQGVAGNEFIAKVEEFANWLRTQPEVSHVNTITDTLKRLNKNMHADDETYYKLPENRELTAQYLLLYEMSLPYGLDLNNQINVDKAKTRLAITLKDVDTETLIAFSTRGEEWLKKNAPESMHTTASSPAVMFAHITERNVKGMAVGMLLAFFLITVSLMIALGSFKYGLISLLPNVLPAVISYGLWSVLVGEAGFAIAVVGSVTLGIVVDDTVHFLAKYVRAKRDMQLDSDEAIKYALSDVGPALISTSVVLVLGFSVLMFSAFEANFVLGALSALTIAVALIVDFTFLPAVLSYLDKKKDTASLEMKEARGV